MGYSMCSEGVWVIVAATVRSREFQRPVFPFQLPAAHTRPLDVADAVLGFNE